ncbi:hypothetical protein LCGC14_0708700 [marine sediment metagenome]|uniref:Uncharacterized protein n=1 Tax=marine sediment metagenome TaxID=412755 RepID=A0A0F9T1L5_9ZZZZ
MTITTAGGMWAKPIKEIGNGYIKFIARCIDLGADLYIGTGMEIGNNGELIKYTTAQPDWQTGITVAELIPDDDRYFIAKKNGAEILHNQKLASTYGIGDAVYQTGAGTWSLCDESDAESLLHTPAFVVGPADRFTAGVLKDIDDAFTSTEGIDILI